MKTTMRSKPRCSLSVLLSSLLLVTAITLPLLGQESALRDTVIGQIVKMDDGTISEMIAFVDEADALLDTDPGAREAMLVDPMAWFAGREIGFRDAIVWTIDLTIDPPDAEPWLFISPYSGDQDLKQEALVFSGSEVATIFQVSDTAAPGATSPTEPVQSILEQISARSESEWEALRRAVLGLNLPGSTEERAFAVLQTRMYLDQVAGVQLSSGNTKVTSVLIPLGEEYGAVHFGEIPEGQILMATGIAIVGDSAVIIYNGTF